MLTLSNVRKSYGDLVAVDGLSLSVQPGEIFGLLGPNGAGKSTTVLMAVGLLPPDAGTVTIGDLGSPTRADVRRLLGVAPQSLALYDDLTADENLRFFGQMYGLSGAHLAARVDAALALVGLTDRRRDRARTYSGGMKRRLNLAVGARARTATPAPRRTDGRRRSAVAQRDPRPDPRVARRGTHHRLHDALHGGGRAPLRSRRHHGSRETARRRYGRCADPGARWPPGARCADQCGRAARSRPTIRCAR